VERIGLRLHLRKQQAEASDIVLLFADESEALTHPYLARAWAPRGADLRVPAPGQARKVALLGALDHASRRLLVTTARTKRSSDFIGLLEQLGGLYGPRPGQPAKPVVIVLDNGPIHTSKASRAALDARRHWLTVEWLPRYRPTSTTSRPPGATSRPIISPTAPSQTSTISTGPSTTPSPTSTGATTAIRWPARESPLSLAACPNGSRLPC
jgi:hypothetical protein